VGARELLDRRVAEVLHPRLQCLAATQLARGILLEVRDGLGDVAPEDLARDAGLLLDHAGELLDTPLVRLVKVDDGAQEAARHERVQITDCP